MLISYSLSSILILQTANILLSSQFSSCSSPYLIFFSFLPFINVPDPAVDVALEELGQWSDDPRPVSSVGPLVVHLLQTVKAKEHTQSIVQATPTMLATQVTMEEKLFGGKRAVRRSVRELPLMNFSYSLSSSFTLPSEKRMRGPMRSPASARLWHEALHGEHDWRRWPRPPRRHGAATEEGGGGEEGASKDGLRVGAFKNFLDFSR